jgi:hypothetical protein
MDPIVSQNADITGVQADGAVGTVSMGERTVALTGVVAQGLTGDESRNVTVALSGVSASGAPGNVIFNKIAALTGVAASGSVGSVSMGQRLVAVTGCQAMGNVGNFGVFYWSLIDDAQNANWTLVKTE